MSIFSDNDPNSPKSDGKYDSDHDPDVDMCMEDNVNALDCVDLEGNVDMERDGDDEEEEDEEEEDEEEEDEDEKEDQDEKEDKDEDDGKEPQTIHKGEMVHTLADDVDTMVDDQPIVLPKPDQKMRKHTPRPQTAASAQCPEPLEPRPQPPTPETYPPTGLV